ncbi:MAG: hypothetical protein RLY97_975 [Pseudomonadota bacterium]
MTLATMTRHEWGMIMAIPTIRDATLADAEALAALKLFTFHQTFIAGYAIPYPPDDLALFEAETYSVAQITAELMDATHQTWVAEQGGALVGYVHCGPCKLPHADVGDGDRELYQLYLTNDAQGFGLGRQLLDLAVRWMKQGTGAAMWIGVWSGNDRARAIYAARGFAEVGEYQFKVGDWRDDEFVLHKAL